MTVVPFNVERQNSAGEGRSSRGQPRPYRKGAGPQRSPLFGSSSIYVMCGPFDAELLNLMWKWLVFSGYVKRPPQGGGVQCSPILGVPLYLCMHPLRQSY